MAAKHLRDEPAKTKTPKASVLWTRIVPGVGALGSLVWIALLMWSNDRSLDPSSRPNPAPSPPTRLVESEARQLARRAQALYEPWDGATRGDFAMAEQLLKRAVELDPSDSEAWAAYGLLTCGQIILGHDRSPARIEIARTASERAVKLAPESNQARFAQAFYYRFTESSRGQVETQLRDLLVKMPGDRLLIRTLASVLRAQRKYDEAIALLDRAIALPGGDPVALLNKYLALSSAKKFKDAEAVIDHGIATRPMPYFLRAKASLLIMVHGDLDRATEMLKKVPSAYLLEDSGAYWASQLWLWRREPNKALAVWRDVSRDVIETTEFNGPKAFIVGQAHRLAGRSAAAEAEWRAALRVVEQLHAAHPSAVQWVYWKARLFASLGQHAEAEAALHTFEQLIGAKGVSNHTIPVYLLLDRKVEVLAALERAHADLAEESDPASLAQLVNNLRFNPEWDALRGEERFAKLLARPKS
jgi:tetratricopeptide (TPR) repeat protein